MKPLRLLAILSILILSACALTKPSAVEYNNRVVEQINATSTKLEETATLYNDAIPDVVTEKDEIETSEMKTSFNQAKQALSQVGDILVLESRNEEQQAATIENTEVYIDAAQLYIEAYQNMLTYYESDTYVEDISQVQTLDETLHTHYTTFIEANNDLVETMENFVE